MVSQDFYQSLLNAAFRFVSYRPRSAKEIHDFLGGKLKRWNVAGSATLTKVLKRLEELNYIDDRKFAEWWVDQRNAFRPKGLALLSRELYQKGVSRSLIEEVLSSRTGSELEAAKIVAAKKFKLLGRLTTREQQKKLYGLLGRRGFSPDVIRNVVDEVTSKGV